MAYFSWTHACNTAVPNPLSPVPKRSYINPDARNERRPKWLNKCRDAKSHVRSSNAVNPCVEDSFPDSVAVAVAEAEAEDVAVHHLAARGPLYVRVVVALQS